MSSLDLTNTRDYSTWMGLMSAGQGTDGEVSFDNFR